MKKVVIDIGETGNVRIEAVGYEGADCEKVTQALEEAIGEVEKRTFKPEHRRAKAVPRAK